MMDVENILSKISPKIVLDHYSIVVSLIDIHGIFDKEKRLFDEFDIKNEISERCEELRETNPLLYRVYLRSLNVVDEVIEKLSETKILLKQGGKYIKSDDFSGFSQTIKVFKGSVGRWISWAIYFLCCNGLTKFSTQDLRSVISFEHETYIAELPHLVVSKDGKWNRVLKQYGDKWRPIETPHRARPAISINLSYRLSHAILKLAEIKDEFSTEEIVTTVKQQEYESIERVLRKFYLRRKNEQWYLDEKNLEEVERVLLRHPLSQWPFFGVTVTKKPSIVKLETKTLYVDVPNEWISRFLHQIDILGRENEDIREFYRKSLGLRDEWNKLLRENGNWLKFVIYRRRRQEAKLGVHVRINWDRFHEFLENVAVSNFSLEDKYDYLSLCRGAMGWMRSKPHEHQMMERVKTNVGPEIKEANVVIDDIIDKMTSFREKLRRRAVRRGHFPLSLAYVHEASSAFEVIRSCLVNGVVSACYREMRKILEDFSWVVFEDLLASRNKDFTSYFVPPCRMLSKRWYDWAGRKNVRIKSLAGFRRSILKTIDAISSYSESKSYSWSKKRIEASILNNLSYPLFILSIGIDKQVSDEIQEAIPIYPKGRLKAMVTSDIEKILRELKGNKLSSSDKLFAKKLIEDVTTEGQDNLVVPYPSNRFVLEFVSKVLNQNLYSCYKRYSYFVHSYVKTWQFLPFSSVLEFKILKHELNDYVRIFAKAMQFCSKNI